MGGRADRRTGADVRVLPPDYEWCGPLSLAGPHQRRNAAVAHGILCALPAPYRPSPAQIERAFGDARIPGRLDRRGRWLFDVAHNPDGMRALVAALAVLRPARPLHALVSILGDKEWPDMLVQLDQAIDRGVLTIAPTAAARGGTSNGWGGGSATPRAPTPCRMDPGAGFHRGADRQRCGTVRGASRRSVTSPDGIPYRGRRHDSLGNGGLSG